jgi:hypothetical protein
MADSAGADRRDPELEPGQSDGYRFRRPVGLASATAINMTPMTGIGPFITNPLMVVTFAGAHEALLQAQRGHPELVALPDTGGEASWA